MRPRKEVLLLVRSEDDLGLWRMRLEVWGYGVHGFLTLGDAQTFLAEAAVDAIATTVRGGRGADALAAAYRNVLLFGVKGPLAPGFAHRLELDGPVLAERVRETLKTMCAKKRGPKKKAEGDAAKKPVQGVRPAEIEERAA